MNKNEETYFEWYHTSCLDSVAEEYNSSAMGII